jgi:small-conductance mechanosensitive channel
MAFAAAGVETTQFAIIAGALGVGIGFGLQNVVNNFVSGLILAFERPVQAGDAVQVGDVWGEVRRIGVRSSTVRTWSGAEVIVPNADLISNQVTNWTLSDRQRRMEIPIGVAYGTNPHQVIELATGCAKNHPQVLSSPEPRTIFTGFGESSLDFELRAWTEEFDNYLATKSDLLLAVHDALYAAGIEIPFPQRDLHLRTVDGEAASRLTGRAPPQPSGASPEDAAGSVPDGASGGEAGGGSEDSGATGASESAGGTSGDDTGRGSA